jgi:hypothetical protein
MKLLQILFGVAIDVSILLCKENIMLVDMVMIIFEKLLFYSGRVTTLVRWLDVALKTRNLISLRLKVHFFNLIILIIKQRRGPSFKSNGLVFVANHVSNLNLNLSHFLRAHPLNLKQ